MTDLSVIVVSYNVRAFLEQCLVSVERAMEGMAVDVWVVDNRSVDGSVDMVRRRFPWVHLVANEENVGFSVANNQAIRECSGRYVLLLNPDTVVREDTFRTCLVYADANPKLGGLGVPMHDGTGRFLPESKRGLPTPWAAFCRMSGLHRWSPRSRTFNSYYAGHVATDETATVDILSGAFMWMRKDALDEVGLLDEQFFMYGEDIDLSWRLVAGGWENHYLAQTSIIHYKGESTKKGSLNYVLIFYRAMLLFAAKHFEGSQARAFSSMIRGAIYGRAGLAVVRRVASRWGDLIRAAGLTALWVLVCMLGIEEWGGKVFVWPEAAGFAMTLVAAQTVGTWSLGGYREPRSVRTASGHVLAWLGASMLTLVIYSLWPESWRFSRSVVLALVLGHGLMHGLVVYRSWKQRGNPFLVRRLLVAGDDMPDMVELLRRNEGERVRHQSYALWAGDRIPKDAPTMQGVPWIGVERDVEEAVQIHDLDEVVFSGRDVQAQVIVQALPNLGSRHVKCRIAWTDAGDVMSSGGASREAFVAFQHGLHLPQIARTKRAFDVIVSLGLGFAAPWLMATGRSAWIGASWHVLLRRATWVSPGNLKSDLPFVFNVSHGLSGRSAERKAFTHAQDYHWRKDLAVVSDALISRRAIISHGHY